MRQLELLTNRPTEASDVLEEAVSVLQHHDSITGTEKQHVTDDYHKRLAKGKAEWLLKQASRRKNVEKGGH